MTTTEVANRLVSLCREGKNLQAVEELYDKNIVSLEPEGTPNPRTEGFEAVKGKTTTFMESVVEIHGGSTSDPIVAGDFFTVQMGMDVTFQEIGRMQMNELAVYEVQNGKIVKEQFFYNSSMG